MSAHLHQPAVAPDPERAPPPALPNAPRRAVSGDRLSPREKEILRLIALGHTSAEIATELDLSRRTVETHRAHIHRKLALRTRAELVRYALDRHLLGVFLDAPDADDVLLKR